MKSVKRKVLLGAATIASIAGMSDGANALTAKMDVTAEVIAAIQINAVVAMDFGQLTVDAAGGTLQLTHADNRVDGGGVSLVGLATAGQPGGFQVVGAPAVPYDVTLPAGNITITNTGPGGETMTVNAFTIDGGGNTTTGNGTNTYAVGATLNVGASQAVGTYEGDVVITANYQ